MANFVRPEGSLSARLVVVGEAPGEREDVAKRPFVGATGATLADWWRQSGLQRSDFYLTNVLKERPPNNDLTKVDPNEIRHAIADLRAELDMLEDPWLIVPMGNLALSAVLGKTGILKHRGSIYGYERSGGLVKTIPTIHPAATFREPRLGKRCIRDWQRIAGDSQFRELRLPEREHYIRPSLADVEHFVRLVDKEADSLALDIETPRGVWTCIGFSYDAGFSITIPLTRQYWGDDCERIWQLVAGLLASDIPKTMQNGLFDSYYIRWHGLVVNNWQWDTLAMHHALEPVDEHSLAYMASLDTREPYWKDEAKDPDEMAKYARHEDAFWVYNGKDVAVTYELQETYFEQLTREERDEHSAEQSIRQQYESRGEHGVHSRLRFYQRHYRDMFEPLLGMSLSGIRLDEGRRLGRHDQLKMDAETCLHALTELAGEPLHAKTGLSPIKLKRFMYETLGLPKQTNRARGSVTTDETAIRRLMQRYPDKFRVAGQSILDFRRYSKLATFMAGGLADDDGFVRCQYRFTTDTGRLSSSSNPRGTGMNLQNIDREARDIFFPHPGHILLECDLSQAEDRWVKAIAYSWRDDERFKKVKCDWDQVIWRARAMPWENDEHWRAADTIFQLPRDQMTKAFHRYLGKRTRHAVNYGEGPNKYAEVLMLEDIHISPAQARQMLGALLAGDPYISVYQEATRGEIIERRSLDNSWQRRYDFTYARLDDSAYRQGYAFRPQSEVADLENQCGVIPLYWWLRNNAMESILMAQVHDAVLVSCKPEEAWAIYQFLNKNLTVPRVFRGVELSIPVEVAIGLSWANKKGWDRDPTEEEFNERVASLVVSSEFVGAATV